MALAIAQAIEDQNESGSSFDATINCTGSNTVLLVFTVCYNGASVSVQPTGVTYNGDALTHIRTDVYSTGGERQGNSAWYRIAPDTGSNTITVTMAGTVDNCDIYAICFTGADQTSPIDANDGLVQQGSTVDPITKSITTVAADCYVASAMNFWSGGGGAVDEVYMTEFANTHIGSNVGAYSGTHSAGSVTHSYSRGSADEGVITLVSVKPLSATTAIKDMIGGGFILFPR